MSPVSWYVCIIIIFSLCVFQFIFYVFYIRLKLNIEIIEINE